MFAHCLRYGEPQESDALGVSQMQADLSIFPALNASLNGASGVLLVVGHSFIQHGKVAAHRACNAGGIHLLDVFLACYLYYHFHAGVIRFHGQGWIRPVYFTLLSQPHPILAVAVVPMVLDAGTCAAL